MGLLHFARRRAGAVVLEVGMGGRLDSTNVVRPALAVLTTISFDHTRQLGTTLGAIAGEKAGILKRGRPAVSGVRGDEARAAIHRVAAAAEVARSARSTSTSTTTTGPPSRPCTGPTAGPVAVRTWRSDWGRSTCRCSARTRATTPPSPWPRSTPWPSRASRSAAGGRGPGVRRA